MRAASCVARLSAAWSLEPAAAHTAGRLVELMQAELEVSVLALYVCAQRGAVLQLAEQRGLAPDIAGRVETRTLADGVVARAASAGEVQVVELDKMPADLTAGVDPLLRGFSSGVACALPLIHAGRPLGVVWAVDPRQGAEVGGEREGLVVLARVVALAVAEALSRTKHHRSRARIERERDASRALFDALSVVPEQQVHAAVRRGFCIWPQYREASVTEFVRFVIQQAVDRARDVSGAEIGAIGIGDIPERSFEPWAFSGVSESVRRAIGRTPRPIGVLGLVACEGKTVRVADVREHPAFLGLPAHHPPVKSLLATPIKYRGRAMGNLYLANKIGASEFSPEDEKGVEALAHQTAIALQQAFLQASVEAQRAQTQSLLDSAPHGILFVDAQTRGVMANPSAMRLLGETILPDEGVEQYTRRFRNEEGQPVSPEETAALRALKGEERPSAHFTVLRRDGTEVPIVETAAPVRGFGDKILGAVVNFDDVTAVREVERMRNLERVRQEFNAMIAHDLRNPIQTVLAQIQLLLSKARGDEVSVPVQALQRIERSARTLGRLAEGLLHAARVELKRADLACRPSDVRDVTTELVERLRPAFAPEGHEIRISVEGPLPRVDLDELAFEQILTNLITNAAKFSPPHSPVDVHVRPHAAGVMLSVRDEGIGIAPEDLSHLFDRFARATRPDRKKGGLGLGLSIVKGYAEAHGGHVEVQSQVGKGTTFHVWFPPSGQRKPPSP